MKPERKTLLCVAVCMMLFLSPSMVSAQKTLRIGYEDWPPFQYQNDKKELTGLDIELVNAIFDKADITVAFALMPWKRILHSIEYGKLDIALSATPTAERKKYADFSVPYRNETYALMVRKGESKKFPFITLQDLAEHPKFLVANVRGCYLGETFEKLRKDPGFANRIQIVSKDILSIKMAKNRYIHGFFAEPNYVFYTSKRMGWGDIFEIHPMPVISSPVHLMLSKKTISPAFKEIINQCIAEIKADGRYQAIIKSYLN